MLVEVDNTPDAAQPSVQIHAEIIRCGLQDRTIGGLMNRPDKSSQVLLLQGGSMRLRHDEPGGASFEREYHAPALIWLPWKPAPRILARAGTVGAHLVLGERTVANAIGHRPEAADMRQMSALMVHLSLSEHPELLNDVARAIDLVLREASHAAPGMETVIEAQVRVLLVHLWRHAALPDELRTASPSAAQILQQFRQLLETHFRDRWSAGAYAGALGMSSDRLHDICTRTLGKPPLQLIHERLAHEAQLLLERSSQTVDQIALFLGFRSAAQFNKFFKSRFGQPPGIWRRKAQSRTTAQTDMASRSYADWP